MQVFLARAMLIRAHLERFSSRNVDVLYTRSLFRFSREIEVTAFELDIPQALDIRSIVDGKHCLGIMLQLVL